MQNLDCEESITTEVINCDDLDLSDWESSSSDNTQISSLEHTDISIKDNNIFSQELKNCLQESELGSQNQDSRTFRRTEILPYETVGGNMRGITSFDQTFSIQENSTYNLGSRKTNVAPQTYSECRQNISSHPVSSKINCFKSSGLSQPREEFDVNQCYERIITSSQEMFQSQEMITSSQESFGSQRMVTSSQETFDGQRMIASSQEIFDGQSMITSSQETFDSQRMLTSSQETFDSQRMLTSSQETFDSQRMITSSQESCNNPKTLTLGQKNFEEITVREICSIRKKVLQSTEDSEQVTPLEEMKQSKIMKTKVLNSVTKALPGANCCRRSDKYVKSKIIQKDFKIKKRKGGCKKSKVSAKEVKGDKSRRRTALNLALTSH